MPHVIVKLYAGRTEEHKARIAAAVTQAITQSVGSAEDDVSVSIEDVAREDWAETVYKPDIMARPDTLYKKPGYDPLR